MLRVQLFFTDGSSRPCRRFRPALPCDAARQRPAAGVLRRSGLRRLPRLAGRGGARSAGDRLGVVSDAQPRPSHPRPARRRRPARRAGASASSIHARRRRTGHFWQGRYGAVAMDEDHLAAAYRYVNLNPVRARLVERAEDWPWSSARALLGLAEDGLTDLAPARQRFSRFADLLEADEDEGATARLRKGESVGRPAGSDTFLAALETKTRRRLHAHKRGPKPKDDGATAAAK